MEIPFVTSDIGSDLVYKQGHVLLHWGYTLLWPNTGTDMVDSRSSWPPVPRRSPKAALETPRSTRTTAVLASPPSWDLVAAVCRSEIVLCHPAPGSLHRTLEMPFPDLPPDVFSQRKLVAVWV